MTSTVISLLVVIGALLIVLVLVSVLFFRALRDVHQFADSLHIRAQQSTDRLLDRVMAGDFAIFKAYQAAEEAPEGSWEPPEPEERMPEPSLAEQLDEGERFTLAGMRLPPERPAVGE